MTSPRRVAIGLAVLVVALLLGAPARAQMQQVTPYFAVVSGEDVMLRSGGGDLLYPVAKLTKGQLLRVDAEGAGWARVAYPPGTAAFIAAESFQPDATAKGGAISKPNKLKAFNLTTGVRGSWKDLLDTALPAGTKLALVEPEATPDGRGNSYYKVEPPKEARAFVQTGGLQKATQEQINAAMAASKPGTAALGATPPNGTGVASAKDGHQVRSLAEPMVPPTVKPGDQQATAPQATAPAPGEPPTNPAAPANPNTTAQAPAAPAVAPKAAEIPASPYEKLEAAFEAVRKQPADQAEYTELMAEIEKTIASLDDSPQSGQIKPRLQQRLNYLKLQSDIREQKRKLAEAQGSFKENDELIKKRLEELDKVRQYTIVGRLSASTLYDGQRLPLMYRIQTVGGPNPRTLAYLKPDAKLGIDSKLGQVVGVVGESVVDPSLRLNIITPLRVDALEPAMPATSEAPSSPPTPAPAPPKSPSSGG
jgi:hypothetical protein